MQRLKVSGAVRPLYGVVSRQRVNSATFVGVGGASSGIGCEIPLPMGTEMCV